MNKESSCSLKRAVKQRPTINNNIEKGLSGPYAINSLTPQQIMTGVQVRADYIPEDAFILAISYAHKDRDIVSKS